MPTGKEIRELLKTKEYDFLRTHPFLGDNICYLTVGGSIGYGTSLPEKKSDVDIRGITLETDEELSKALLYMDHFEQVLEPETDTVVYGFNKILKLLLECNPNTIEMLGPSKEFLIYENEVGKQLRLNADMFLSKRAIASFGGYAGQQLNRMLNALARDRLEQREKEEHILRSVKSAMGTFNERYADFSDGFINMYIGDSDKPELDGEIFADISLKRYPLREFNSILNELGNISRTYNKVNHRNHKKDDEHMNKHAMHLVRLYLMAIDILSEHKIVTYRAAEQQMLLDIRRGKYMNEDGTYKKEFFELVDSLEQRFLEEAKSTTLPDKPNYQEVISFAKSVRSGKYFVKDEIEKVFDEL